MMGRGHCYTCRHCSPYGTGYPSTAILVDLPFRPSQNGSYPLNHYQILTDSEKHHIQVLALPLSMAPL